MAIATERRVAVIADIPTDLRSAMAERFVLVDMADGRPRSVSGLSVALTTSMTGAPADLIAALPELRTIVCHGGGLDRFDMEALGQRKIAVRNTPDVVADDTADMAVALIYAAARGIVRADRFVRTGQWRKSRIAQSHRVFGKRAGIVGLGRIGSRIAQRLSGAGLAVAYAGRRQLPDVDHDYFPDALALAEAVDFLILSCTAGPGTHHLANAAVLEALGPKGFLINVSRGSVVDEEALIAALQTGTIAGAGLDVFENEPEIDPRFLALDSVVLQPHAASITHETRAAMIATIRSLIEESFSDKREQVGRDAPAPGSRT